jgi:hypothetical protein
VSYTVVVNDAVRVDHLFMLGTCTGIRMFRMQLNKHDSIQIKKR